MEINRHFIKEKNVKSDDQLADILTKAMSGKAFHKILDKLGLDDIYAST